MTSELFRSLGHISDEIVQAKRMKEAEERAAILKQIDDAVEKVVTEGLKRSLETRGPVYVRTIPDKPLHHLDHLDLSCITVHADPLKRRAVVTLGERTLATLYGCSTPAVAAAMQRFTFTKEGRIMSERESTIENEKKAFKQALTSRLVDVEGVRPGAIYWGPSYTSLLCSFPI
jgi:hypothetical protein